MYRVGKQLNTVLEIPSDFLHGLGHFLSLRAIMPAHYLLIM
jgi:hypothetical protein